MKSEMNNIYLFNTGISNFLSVEYAFKELNYKVKKISNFEKYKTFFWLSLAMIPNLISAMCAITWHIFDTS